MRLSLILLRVYFRCETTFFHFFLLLFKFGFENLFFFTAHLLFNLFLLLLDINFNLVLLIILMDQEVFLRYHQVRTLLIVKLLNEFIIRFIEVFGPFNLILLEVNLCSNLFLFLFMITFFAIFLLIKIWFLLRWALFFKLLDTICVYSTATLASFLIHCLRKWYLVFLFCFFYDFHLLLQKFVMVTLNLSCISRNLAHKLLLSSHGLLLCCLHWLWSSSKFLSLFNKRVVVVVVANDLAVLVWHQLPHHLSNIVLLLTLSSNGRLLLLHIVALVHTRVLIDIPEVTITWIRLSLILRVIVLLSFHICGLEVYF